MSSNVNFQPNSSVGRTHSAPNTPMPNHNAHSFAGASSHLTNLRTYESANSAFHNVDTKSPEDDSKQQAASLARYNWSFPPKPMNSIGVVGNGQFETAINLANPELKMLLTILSRGSFDMSQIKKLSKTDLEKILKSDCRDSNLDPEDFKAQLLAKKVSELVFQQLNKLQEAAEKRELELKEIITACHCIVAVDGGINFLTYLEIFTRVVKWVGDMDSGYIKDPQIVLKNFSEINLEKLERPKDHTDLKEGCDWALKMHEEKQMIVHGVLGNRIDHTLSNLYLLLQKDMHGRVFFYTNDQIVFSLAAGNGEICVHMEKYQTLSLISLYELADTEISECKPVSSLLSDRIKIYHPLASQKQLKILVKRGEAIVCIDKRKIEPLFSRQETLNNFRKTPEHQISFLLPMPLCTIFEQIFALTAQTTSIPILRGKETIYMIHAGQDKSFDCGMGTTVSLIPVGGAAIGLSTKNLAWELGTEITTLDKMQLSQSNVVIGHYFHVYFNRNRSKGNLLCIITKEDPDMEMIKLRAKQVTEKDNNNNNNTNPAQEEKILDSLISKYRRDELIKVQKKSKNGHFHKYYTANNNNSNSNK